MTHTTPKVSILGSGLVGGMLALMLSRKGVDVHLIEKQTLDESLKDQSDGRGLALSQGTRQWLMAMDLWQPFEAYATPIHRINVTSYDGDTLLSHDKQDVGSLPLGYIVPSHHMRSGIKAHLLAQKENLTIHEQRTLGDLVSSGNTVTLKMGDGLEEKNLTSHLVLACDGRRSFTRHFLRLPTFSWQYQQKALVFSVTHTKPHENVAYEHFLPRGPLAFLPMPGNRSSVVWTESSQVAEALMALPQEAFNVRLQRAFGHALGDLSCDDGLFTYPLGGHLCLKPTQKGVMLVGDAFHGIHPVAGQGYNLGLRDVQWLCDHMSSSMTAQELQALPSRYQRARAFDVTSMTAFTHAMVKGFGVDLPLVGWIRHQGLGLVNRLTPLKNRITRHAMGLS